VLCTQAVLRAVQRDAQPMIYGRPHTCITTVQVCKAWPSSSALHELVYASAQGLVRTCAVFPRPISSPKIQPSPFRLCVTIHLKLVTW
jgi:hypothetical protein